MASVEWGNVFEPITGNNLTIDGVGKTATATSCLETGGASKAALQTIVSNAKECLAQGFSPLDESTTTPELTTEGRKNLYLRLHDLQHRVTVHNKDIDDTMWITIVHVILAVLTLGIFSFRNSMKIENLTVKVQELLGIDDVDDAKAIMTQAISYQDFAALPQELRASLAKELEFEDVYAGITTLDWFETIGDPNSNGPQTRLPLSQFVVRINHAQLQKLPLDTVGPVSLFPELFSPDDVAQTSFASYRSLPEECVSAAREMLKGELAEKTYAADQMGALTRFSMLATKGDEYLRETLDSFVETCGALIDANLGNLLSALSNEYLQYLSRESLQEIFSKAGVEMFFSGDLDQARAVFAHFSIDQVRSIANLPFVEDGSDSVTDSDTATNAGSDGVIDSDTASSTTGSDSEDAPTAAHEHILSSELFYSLLSSDHWLALTMDEIRTLAPHMSGDFSQRNMNLNAFVGRYIADGALDASSAGNVLTAIQPFEHFADEAVVSLLQALFEKTEATQWTSYFASFSPRITACALLAMGDQIASIPTATQKELLETIALVDNVKAKTALLTSYLSIPREERTSLNRPLRFHYYICLTADQLWSTAFDKIGEKEFTCSDYPANVWDKMLDGANCSLENLDALLANLSITGIDALDSAKFYAKYREFITDIRTAAMALEKLARQKQIAGETPPESLQVCIQHIFGQMRDLIGSADADTFNGLAQFPMITDPSLVSEDSSLQHFFFQLLVDSKVPEALQREVAAGLKQDRYEQIFKDPEVCKILAGLSPLGIRGISENPAFVSSIRQLLANPDQVAQNPHLFPLFEQSHTAQETLITVLYNAVVIHEQSRSQDGSEDVLALDPQAVFQAMSAQQKRSFIEYAKSSQVDATELLTSLGLNAIKIVDEITREDLTTDVMREFSAAELLEIAKESDKDGFFGASFPEALWAAILNDQSVFNLETAIELIKDYSLLQVQNLPIAAFHAALERLSDSIVHMGSLSTAIMSKAKSFNDSSVGLTRANEAMALFSIRIQETITREGVARITFSYSLPANLLWHAVRLQDDQGWLGADLDMVGWKAIFEDRSVYTLGAAIDLLENYDISTAKTFNARRFSENSLALVTNVEEGLAILTSLSQAIEKAQKESPILPETLSLVLKQIDTFKDSANQDSLVALARSDVYQRQRTQQFFEILSRADFPAQERIAILKARSEYLLKQVIDVADISTVVANFTVLERGHLLVSNLDQLLGAMKDTTSTAFLPLFECGDDQTPPANALTRSLSSMLYQIMKFASEADGQDRDYQPLFAALSTGQKERFIHYVAQQDYTSEELEKIGLDPAAVPEPEKAGSEDGYLDAQNGLVSAEAQAAVAHIEMKDIYDDKTLDRFTPEQLLAIAIKEGTSGWLGSFFLNKHWEKIFNSNDFTLEKALSLMQSHPLLFALSLEDSTVQKFFNRVVPKIDNIGDIDRVVEQVNAQHTKYGFTKEPKRMIKDLLSQVASARRPFLTTENLKREYLAQDRDCLWKFTSAESWDIAIGLEDSNGWIARDFNDRQWLYVINQNFSNVVRLLQIRGVDAIARFTKPAEGVAEGILLSQFINKCTAMANTVEGAKKLLGALNPVLKSITDSGGVVADELTTLQKLLEKNLDDSTQPSEASAAAAPAETPSDQPSEASAAAAPAETPSDQPSEASAAAAPAASGKSSLDQLKEAIDGGAEEIVVQLESNVSELPNLTREKVELALDKLLHTEHEAEQKTFALELIRRASQDWSQLFRNDNKAIHQVIYDNLTPAQQTAQRTWATQPKATGESSAEATVTDAALASMLPHGNPSDIVAVLQNPANRALLESVSLQALEAGMRKLSEASEADSAKTLALEIVRRVQEKVESNETTYFGQVIREDNADLHGTIIENFSGELNEVYIQWLAACALMDEDDSDANATIEALQSKDSARILALFTDGNAPGRLGEASFADLNGALAAIADADNDLAKETLAREIIRCQLESDDSTWDSVFAEENEAIHPILVRFLSLPEAQQCMHAPYIARHFSLDVWTQILQESALEDVLWLAQINGEIALEWGTYRDGLIEKFGQVFGDIRLNADKMTDHDSLVAELQRAISGKQHLSIEQMQAVVTSPFFQNTLPQLVFSMLCSPGYTSREADAREIDTDTVITAFAEHVEKIAAALPNNAEAIRGEVFLALFRDKETLVGLLDRNANAFAAAMRLMTREAFGNILRQCFTEVDQEVFDRMRPHLAKPKQEVLTRFRNQLPQ